MATNYAGEVGAFPTEGLFRTGSLNDPGKDLYLRAGGKIIALTGGGVVDSILPKDRKATTFQSLGIPTGGIQQQEYILDKVLGSLGISKETYENIPVYNPEVFSRSALAREQQIAPSSLDEAVSLAKPFSQKIAGFDREQLPPGPSGRLATSVGSAPAPQIVAASSGPLPPTFSFASSTTVAPEMSALQQNVMNATGAAANDNFVNAAFKAFHGRDANAQELAAFRGKPVDVVRSQIIGGAQAAGLPTVAPKTVPGDITPEQAVQQGLQRVLRPDQLSALSKDQIIRDTRGGIYLRPETTTQEQRDLIASGAMGKDLQKSFTELVEKPGANLAADVMEKALLIPSGKDALIGVASYTPQTLNLVKEAITTTAPVIQKEIAALDKQIMDLNTAQVTAETEQKGIIDRIKDFFTGTANQDALERVRQEEGIREKQAKLTEVLSKISAQESALGLGLSTEANKLAPLGIIGRRQQTLRDQAAAQIAALTGIAKIYQGELDFAKEMMGMTLDAINKDRGEQMDALKFLSDIAEKKIVSLKDDEKQAVQNRLTLLRDEQQQSQKNFDQLFDLIEKNPEAAVKGNVTVLDNPSVALTKMTPYMAQIKTEETRFDQAKKYIDIAKDIPEGDMIELSDGTVIVGTKKGAQDTFTTTDDFGNVRIIDKNTGQIINELKGVGKSKTQPSNVSVNFPRQTQNALYDARGNQVGFSIYNPITGTTQYKDFNGRSISFPTGGRVGGLSSQFDEEGSLDDIAQ